MADSVVPNAVNKMTSVSGETWLTTCTTSNPSMPGIRRSTTINSTGCVRTYSNAAWPLGTAFKMYHSSRKISESDWRATGSSSTTRIFDFIDHLPCNKLHSKTTKTQSLKGNPLCILCLIIVNLQLAGIIESRHPAHLHPIDPVCRHAQ